MKLISRKFCSKKKRKWKKCRESKRKKAMPSYHLRLYKEKLLSLGKINWT